MDPAEIRDSISKAVTAAFPDHGHDRSRVRTTDERLDGVEIGVLLPRTADERCVTYTIGIATTDAGPVEFAIQTETNQLPLMARNLLVLAAAQLDSGAPFGPGSLVELARPWVDGSACDRLLVAPSEALTIALPETPTDAGLVRFLALIPVVATEAAVVLDKGLTDLLDLLAADDVDVAAPGRSPVA